jgi:alanine racemase
VRNHADLLIRHQLILVLNDLDTASYLNRSLSSMKRRLPVHLKVDTGMTRLGVFPHEMRSFCQGLRRFSSLEPVGLLTHLADAEDREFTRRQRDLFEKARKEFNSHFPGRHLCHELNSQAVIDGLAKEVSPHDRRMIRLGIALYGSYPLERDRKLIDLKPVLRWKTKIVSLKKVSSRTPVSYGRAFHTKRESRVGVLPVGYADSYLRMLSNRASVLVRGKKVPVVGRVCMDMTMIDLTSVPSAQTGDEVILIGKQGPSEIRAEELALKAGTISYEIFCRIAERIQRVYL